MRGTGRTTQQLLKAMERIAQGQSTLYVCKNALNAEREAHRLIDMVEGEFRVTRYPPTVTFPTGRIRFVSALSNADKAQAWDGWISIDHAAGPDWLKPEHEWMAWARWDIMALRANQRMQEQKNPETPQ